MPEGVKSAAASVARNINKALNAVGAGPSPTLDFYGHPFSHPLVEEYFSQCPMRFGDHVAKIGAFPVAAEQKALADWQLDPHQDEDGFRHAAVDYFDGNDAVFELRAQLTVNAEVLIHRIVSIADDSRAASSDHVRFKYRVFPDGEGIIAP